MRVLLAACVLLLASSGCIADDAPQTTGGDGGGDGSDDETDAGTANGDPHEDLPAVFDVVVPVHWNGTTGTFAYGCEYQTTGQCLGHEVVDDDNGPLFADGPGTIRDLLLTLTWSSTAPINDVLSFHVMIMGDCENCTNLELASDEGTSPLSFDLADLNHTLVDGDQLHAYAYSPQGFVHQAPLFAHVSIEQPIQIAGWVSMEIPRPPR